MVSPYAKVLFFTLLLAACGDRSNPARAEASARPTSAPPTSASSVASLASTPPAPHAIAAAGPKPTLEKTKVPTAKEWQTGRETSVLGAAELGCEAKMVREWIRVSCRDANATGAMPSAVEVVKGGGAETYTFARNGIASIVTRFLPGADFSTKVSWDDQSSYPLVLTWVAGSTDLPTPVGRFEGAPDKPVNMPDRKGQCYCFRLIFGGAVPADPSSCAGVPSDAFVPECTRTNHPTVGDAESCAALIECQNMAPSSYAECLPGEVYTSVCPSCRCAKECGPGKSACPKGLDCTDNMGRGGMVCMEP